MDYKDQIQQISQKIQDKKLERAGLEERKSNIDTEINSLTDELGELGLTEDMVEEYLKKEEKEIQKEIEKCNKILNS